MTIRKGEPWGTEIQRPADLRIVDSDAAVAQAYRDSPTQSVGLSGGDLFGSLGRPSERKQMQRLPIDVLHVTADGNDWVAVAHVVMRNGWWRGPLTAVMNVDRLGEWNVAPRAHPNDGRFDVVAVDSSMSLRHRWHARSRLANGTHVPHPQIEMASATVREWVFPNQTGLWIDGVWVADAASVSIGIRPDAFSVLI